jgi:hypothetical protein
LSDTSVQKRETAIRSILETFGVGSVDEVFPQVIKPTAYLGNSALLNIRAISNRVDSLSTAQALFLGECKDSSGDPVPVSFMHTSNVLKTLKENEAASSATSHGTSKTTPRASSGRVSRGKRSNPKGKKKENVNTSSPSAVSQLLKCTWGTNF